MNLSPINKIRIFGNFAFDQVNTRTYLNSYKRKLIKPRLFKRKLNSSEMFFVGLMLNYFKCYLQRKYAFISLFEFHLKYAILEWKHIKSFSIRSVFFLFINRYAFIKKLWSFCGIKYLNLFLFEKERKGILEYVYA